jgi:hypothetical protein
MRLAAEQSLLKMEYAERNGPSIDNDASRFVKDGVLMQREGIRSSGSVEDGGRRSKGTSAPHFEEPSQSGLRFGKGERRSVRREKRFEVLIGYRD